MKVAISKLTHTKAQRDHGSIEDLKDSIQEVGLICPVTINQNYELLAGRRRYQAIKELGWETVECNIINTSFGPFVFHPEEIENKCEICQYPFADLHHILPKQFGGTEEKSNKIYLCANHHRVIHFLIQLDLAIETKQQNKLPKNALPIQTFLLANDNLICCFYKDYLKERILNEANKRNPIKT